MNVAMSEPQLREFNHVWAAGLKDVTGIDATSAFEGEAELLS